MKRKLYFITDGWKPLTRFYEKKRDLLHDYTVESNEVIMRLDAKRFPNFEDFWQHRIEARPAISEQALARILAIIGGVILGVGLALLIH